MERRECDIMMSVIMRVYLDNCCYNRPFDGQGDFRVAIETLAKLLILSHHPPLLTNRTEFGLMSAS